MRFLTHDLVFAMPEYLTSPATTAGHTLIMPVSTTNRSGFRESRVYAKLQMP
jgi:hypothetical protein